MRKKEQRLWDTMKRNAPLKKNLMMERIENLVGEGQPDVMIVGIRSTFIELKAPHPRTRDSSKLLTKSDGSTLRQSQINWIDDAYNRGAPVYVLARADKELFFFGGSCTSWINTVTVAAARELRIADNWVDIFEIIIREVTI